MSQTKDHVNVVIVGHVDSGKSTTTGHLIFKQGGINEREMEKYKKEAESLGKGSFGFAFVMDKQKDERERGITIACTTKEFYTDSKHYTIIDAPGHKDFIKNMISGASQADVAVLMVPANKGGFETSIQKTNRKEGQIQGQTRQHAQLINLLGITQVIVCVNKMDDPSVNYSKDRFEEIKNEMSNMLSKFGYKKSMGRIPFIPMSGFKGENLDKVSDKMPWYKGFECKLKDGTVVKGHTLVDALDRLVQVPKRNNDKPFRMPLSGCFKIKGVGDVVTGKIEQGSVKPNDEVVFAPSGITGKVFSIERHHKRVEEGVPGDNVGINMKGFDKDTVPRTGEVMYKKGDTSVQVQKVKKFVATVLVQEHPGELRPAKDGKGGFTPSVHIRTAKVPCKMLTINWKRGKSTGSEKIKNPVFLKAGEQAEVVFEPQMDFFAETFKTCQGLGRVAVMDSNSLVMLGKITSVE